MRRTDEAADSCGNSDVSVRGPSREVPGGPEASLGSILAKGWETTLESSCGRANTPLRTLAEENRTSTRKCRVVIRVSLITAVHVHEIAVLELLVVLLVVVVAVVELLAVC
jgi:hypothetical protein